MYEELNEKLKIEYCRNNSKIKYENRRNKHNRYH
jgi:hypothetical protein